jgi:hypothetical protein
MATSLHNARHDLDRRLREGPPGQGRIFMLEALQRHMQRMADHDDATEMHGLLMKPFAYRAAA